MSTRLLEQLLDGLIDDAAVFPPGLAPLPQAVDEHLERTAYRRYIGPLLVPATSAAEVVSLAGGAALRVGLIARPGMPIEPVTDSVATLRGSSVQVAGVEVGAAADWRSLVGDDQAIAGVGVPVTVEIPRDGFDAALDAVAEVARRAPAPEADSRVQAKFRTGATETWAWPDEAELARFLIGCVERDLPFKLTGGLHHALRADHPGPDGGPQHGLLNVLAALTCVIDGGDAATVTGLLAERTPEPLTSILLPLLPEQADDLRRHFTAYGCCGVLDPVRELAELDLIDPQE
ncbi:MAG: hypothetical protein CSA84_03025 [Actinomycetales bacterium]|nr:MAG: hypothetical protein CSA84_03025 [Actinomycetales bacterium]